jgi:hypothetical protein
MEEVFMAKIVMAITGISNVGKSTTIMNIYGQLTALPSFKIIELREPRGREAPCEVIVVNGVKIGIESMGDEGLILESSLTKFVQHKCHVILCATRTRGATYEAVESLTSKGYQVIRFRRVPEPQAKQQKSIRSMANEIIKETLP